MADTQLPQTRTYRKWTEDDLRAEALKYSHRSEFKAANRPAYAAALRRGLVDQICEHMNFKLTYWTIDQCRSEAKKFNNRREFEVYSRDCYQAARYNGWLDDVCAHMERLHKQWMDDDLYLEAQRFSSRSEFKRKSQSAYQRARERGILEHACRHMGRPEHRTSSFDTTYIWRPKNCAYVKVGVTSSDLGTSRIDIVARKMGVDPEIIILSTVMRKATELEAEIKQLGIPVVFSGRFDGYSEFRWMSPEELAQAVGIIASNSWLN